MKASRFVVIAFSLLPCTGLPSVAVIDNKLAELINKTQQILVVTCYKSSSYSEVGELKNQYSKMVKDFYQGLGEDDHKGRFARVSDSMYALAADYADMSTQVWGLACATEVQKKMIGWIKREPMFDSDLNPRQMLCKVAQKDTIESREDFLRNAAELMVPLENLMAFLYKGKWIIQQFLGNQTAKDVKITIPLIRLMSNEKLSYLTSEAGYPVPIFPERGEPDGAVAPCPTPSSPFVHSSTTTGQK